MKKIQKSINNKLTHCIGRHWIIEILNCNKEKLMRVDNIERLFLKAAKKVDATIITHHFHQFKQSGVSGFILIKESHFSIHTWPELRYAAVDIFTCSEKMNLNIALNSLQKDFEAKAVLSKQISRGF